MRRNSPHLAVVPAMLAKMDERRMIDCTLNNLRSYMPLCAHFVTHRLTKWQFQEMYCMRFTGRDKIGPYRFAGE